MRTKSADGASAALFVAGMILWYAGGSNANDQLFDGSVLYLPLGGIALVGLVVGTGLTLAAGIKKAATSGLLLAVTSVLVGSTALPLLNRAFDRSPLSSRTATISNVKENQKGPDDLVLQLDQQKLSFWAERGPDCDAGDRAELGVRDGAFGWKWLESISCETPAPFVRQSFEITRMDEIERALVPGALVVFDVDNTMLEPVGMLGSDQWFYALLEQLEKQGIAEDPAVDQAMAMWNEVQDQLPVRSVDPRTPALIAELHAKKIPMLVLTARTDDIAAVTEAQLRSVGINFADKDPPPNIELQLASPAKLINGIVYVGEKNVKGEVLVALLNKLSLKPSRVVFVDDKKKHVESVSEALAAAKISSTVFRFGGADARVEAFRAETADAEYRTWKERR